jgi:outer membrane protein OmpA-like peptidoglycan-associated protein
VPGVVDDLTRALVARDAAALAACFAPDGRLCLRSLERTWVGSGQVRDVAAILFAAFPDLTWQPRARWLDAGRTVEEGTWSGTHRSDLPGFAPAAGGRVELRARVFVEHDEVHVSSVEVYTDVVGLRLALGLPVTALAEAAHTTPLAGNDDADVRVFIRPDDHDPKPLVRRRRMPVVLAVVAAVLTAAAIAGLWALGLPGGTPTAESPRPQPITATTGTTPRSPPAPATSSAQPRQPKPSTGVVVRGNNLDLSTDVLFARGSAVLTVKARGAIAEVARLIRARHVRGVVRVNGYTDNLGSAAYGRTLSLRRAEAVAAALRPRLSGVPVTLQPRGYGEADPVASNATEAGRQLNRRVTIELPR